VEVVCKRTYPLTPTDIDNHRQCRLSALLGYLQNIATEHAEILGVGGDKVMAEHGAFWLIVRLYLKLNRPIRFGEALTIQTWHRGVIKSATIHRDFDLLVGDELIGEAVMSWVLADMEGRKIIKPGSVPALAASPRPAHVKEIIPAKVKMPDALEQAMVRPVYYSDTDLNGHMNNTKYADIACDAIQYDRCRGQFISEVQINYLHECFPGDEILVLRGEQDGVHYVRGTDTTGKNRFEVGMKLDSIS